MDDFSRRRTQITIETISVTTIRGRLRGPYLTYCHQCSSDVTTVRADKTFDMLKLGGLLFEELIISGRLHRLPDSRFCGRSLADCFENGFDNLA